MRFSPIGDGSLPENTDGLLLYGGYPELNARKLEENHSMRKDIREKILSGMPCMAECGGFMYLHEEMEDMEGNLRCMAGVISGKAYRTPKLSRFGYVTLTLKEGETVFGADPGKLPAHEFHYFDSENCGTSFRADKPLSKRGWDCIHGTDRLMAGFPHLYYYGNPRLAQAFLEKCLEYKKERQGGNAHV